MRIVFYIGLIAVVLMKLIITILKAASFCIDHKNLKLRNRQINMPNDLNMQNIVQMNHATTEEQIDQMNYAAMDQINHSSMDQINRESTRNSLNESMSAMNLASNAADRATGMPEMNHFNQMF